MAAWVIRCVLIWLLVSPAPPPAGRYEVLDAYGRTRMEHFLMGFSSIVEGV